MKEYPYHLDQIVALGTKVTELPAEHQQQLLNLLRIDLILTYEEFAREQCHRDYGQERLDLLRAAVRCWPAEALLPRTLQYLGEAEKAFVKYVQ